MQVNQHDWNDWARYLQRNHLIEMFKFLLDASGPVRIIAANTLWMIQPFIQNVTVTELGKILEDQDQSKAFLDFITNKDFNE